MSAAVTDTVLSDADLSDADLHPRTAPVPGQPDAAPLPPRSRAIARFLRGAILSRYTPLLAQLVVTRRCNLACGYCNEYDDHSDPVPLPELIRRIDHIADLGTASITLTGGEPLLHPELDQAIRHARQRGMIVTTITNGYRLSKNWIERLNAAGLHGMQVSVDNLRPDAVSMKSLSSVEKRLELLRDHARFKVNVNSVMGVTEEHAQDIVTVAETAARLGLQHSVGMLHDEQGALEPMSPARMAAYRAVTRISPSLVHGLNYRLFQRNLMRGRPNDWKCRAGARYLYVTEDGRVHWCSQQRGTPGTPLLEYGRADIRREYHTAKPCAPTCTLSCVHQMSLFDRWRGRQHLDPPPEPAVRETPVRAAVSPSPLQSTSASSGSLRTTVRRSAAPSA